MTTRSGREELLLVWKQPATRERYVIGRLWRDASGYYISYERGERRSLEDAIAAGFRLLDSFPEVEGQWHGSQLFATFRRRLPPAWRRDDYHALGLEAWRSYMLGARA